MDRDKVNDLLKQDAYAVGALVALYRQQEAEERRGGKAGFDKKDIRTLSSVAEQYLRRGSLSQAQIKMVKAKLSKYAPRLAEIGFDAVESVAPRKPSKPSASSKKPKENRRYLAVDSKNGEKLVLDFPYDRDTNAEIKKINGYRFDAKRGLWTVPYTINSISKLEELGFEFSKRVREWKEGVVGGVTADISVPGLDDTLYDFQKEAVSYIESRGGRALIADEQGLGKTLESIAWVQYKGRDALPAVVVCPSSVKLNWAEEFARFTDFGTRVEVLSGQSPYRVTGDVAIVNYDILNHWADYLRRNLRPTLVVSDEIHMAKNSQAQRSRALRRLSRNTKYFIGLTGTPILNRPIEIYHPVQCINKNLFPNYLKFVHRYCNPKRNKKTGRVEYKGSSNTAELNRTLTQEIMIRRRKEDVLSELPPRTRPLVPVEIDNRREYDRAAADVVKYIRESDPEKAKSADRARVLAEINVLKQLAARGKLREVANWLDTFSEEEKIVVFCHHKETVEKLMEKFGDRAVKIVGGMTAEQKKEAERKFWNDESVRMLIGNTQAAGTGVNLQVASNACFIEYPWSAGVYSQCEDRVHRIGQDNPVTIWNLVAENTIERQIVDSLRGKAEVAASVTDGVNPHEAEEMFEELDGLEEAERVATDLLGEIVNGLSTEEA